MQLDPWISDRQSQPLAEDIIAPRTASVHADANFAGLQDTDAAGSKWRALIRGSCDRIES